ncbi:RDD family protein, partial [Streptomyces lonarensis]
GHGLPTRSVPAPGHPLAGSAAGQPAFPSPAQPFGAEGAAAPHGPAGAAPLRPVQPLALSATAPWETDLGQAYPAGLGRRLTARVLDSLLPLAAAAAVAWPLVDRARDHVQGKIEAVEQAGVTDTVWLLDTTTAGYLGMVLGAMLLVSLVLEALPSAVWGRSPGKAATGLRLATMDGHDKPGAGSVLVRWLTYSVLGVLLVGLLNVVWCLWDRPWRQCWHDKVAGTFVAAVRRRG